MQLALVESVCSFEGRAEVYKPHGNRKWPMCARHAKIMTQRRWRAENAEESRARAKAFYRKTREARLAHAKAYWEANKERQKAYRAAQRNANRERLRAYHREYRKTHGAERREAYRAWSQSPQGRLVKNALSQQRRARKRNAPGASTARDIQARMDFHGWRCWMCGGDADSIDHVIPLARGGTNWPANLRPACRTCNASKGARSWRLYTPRKEAA